MVDRDLGENLLLLGSRSKNIPNNSSSAECLRVFVAMPVYADMQHTTKERQSLQDTSRTQRSK